MIAALVAYVMAGIRKMPGFQNSITVPVPSIAPTPATAQFRL